MRLSSFIKRFWPLAAIVLRQEGKGISLVVGKSGEVSGKIDDLFSDCKKQMNLFDSRYDVF